MKTAAKAAIGIGVAAGMIGLALALGKPKRAAGPATPPVAEGAGAPAPAKPPVYTPFTLIPEGAGDVIRIDDAAKMLAWAIARAKKLDIKSLTSSAKALRGIARSMSHKKILGVVLQQMPDLGQIPWSKVQDMAGNIPWSGIVPMAQGILASRGLA